LGGASVANAALCQLHFCILPALFSLSCILAHHPDLEADDLKAACAYGARLSQVKRVDPLAA
jgi:hypothetical protein